MYTDFESVQARHHRRQARPSHDCPDQPAIGADMQFLIDELASARVVVERLTEDDEDLRASAEIWCRLYEAALERASACEDAMARSRSSASPHAQTLHDALQRVADLTSALGGLIRECAICARSAVPGEAISKAASDACLRCSRAIEALARPAR
jgi:ATP-dependent exoDNAse (exonuclease V) alpha subunit